MLISFSGVRYKFVVFRTNNNIIVRYNNVRHSNMLNLFDIFGLVNIRDKFDKCDKLDICDIFDDTDDFAVSTDNSDKCLVKCL